MHAVKVKIIQPLPQALILLCLLSPNLLAEAQDSADSKPPAAAASSRPKVDNTAAIEAAYQFVLAKMLVEESAFDQAREAFESVLALDDSDAYSFLEAAKFHSDMASYSRSAERRRHQLLQAAKHADQAVRRAPENRDVLYQYAQIHFRLGEYQLDSLNIAQETLEKLKGSREGDIQLLITLGQIYFMKRLPEKAADVLLEASNFLPNNRMIQNMLVDALFGSGRAEEGEVALAKLVEIDPTNLDERLRLAEMRRENSDPWGAAEVLRSAPPEVRGEVRYRKALAQALFLVGDNQPALEMARKLIDELPDPGEMKRLQASILTSMARYHEAIEEFQDLATSGESPKQLQDTVFVSRLLERVGRSEEAIDLLRSLRDSSSGGSMQLELSLVGAMERHGRSAEAMAMLEDRLGTASAEQMGVYAAALAELLNNADRDDEAVRILDETMRRMRDAGKGDALAGLDLRKLAILADRERWREIVDLAPRLLGHDNADLKAAARTLYAQGLAELGRVEEALETLSAKSGDDRRWLGARLEILFNHGREEEAESQLAKLAESGKSTDLFFAARLYQRKEDYEPVVRLMERLVEDEPESLQALFMLGAAYERQDARGQSIATFQRILEIQPDYAPALNYLGYMWSEQGVNLQQALEMVLRAVALDPDNGAYVDSLGWIYYQLGRYDEAREHLEWASRLVPTDSTIFEHLGDLFVRLEEVSRARDTYQKAVDLGGENAEMVRRKLERLSEKGP